MTMAQATIQVKMSKTVWYFILRWLAKVPWSAGLRRIIALFVAKHSLCVCLFEAGNEVTFYTIAVDGEEIKVVAKK